MPVLEGPRRLERRQLQVPEVGDDGGVLRMEACGLCDTDHEQDVGLRPAGGRSCRGTRRWASSARRLGRGGASRSATARRYRCSSPAARAMPASAASTAGAAATGSSTCTASCRSTGAPGHWSGYATHGYLAHDSLLLPVTDEPDPVLVTLFNPLGVEIRWGRTVPGTKPCPCDVVAVLGAGIRGLSAVGRRPGSRSRARARTGSGPRDAHRLDAAKAFGADVAVDVTMTHPVKAVPRRHPGAGRRLTAKAPAAFGQAADLARAGGTIVVAGTRGVAETPRFNAHTLVYKELRILGPWASAPRRTGWRLELPASGRGTSSPNSPGKWSGSTVPEICCAGWPVRPTAIIPCTRW